jgi:hypothetical protein
LRYGRAHITSISMITLNLIYDIITSISMITLNLIYVIITSISMITLNLIYVIITSISMIALNLIYVIITSISMITLNLIYDIITLTWLYCFLQALFKQLFSFTNVNLFNQLLLRRECCSFSNGEHVRGGLSQVEQWIQAAGDENVGDSWGELRYIRQVGDS